MNLEIPEKLLWVLAEKARYKIAYGGRGSAKSHTFARSAIVKSLQTKTRILCTREYQNSIADSVYRLIVDNIYKEKLESYFHITQTSIENVFGSEFIFKGLQKMNEIKSLEGIDICWIEEASKLSKNSCEVLFPTIRKEGSEIWISYNPELDDDYVHNEFVGNNKHTDAIVRKVNYYDNPFFPEVLKREMLHDKKYDYEKYMHVWEGETVKNTDAQIFKGKWRVLDFDEPKLDKIYQNRFFYGVDWGFAADPSVMIRCFIMNNELYITHEAHGHGIELDELPNLFNAIPEAAKWKSYADNSRPETISHVKGKGFPLLEAAPKWPGSVEDGIEYLRSFKRINIHPRCKETITEFKLYSYKVDKNTGTVLPIVVDKYNHCCDALRYSLGEYIKKKVSIFDVL